MKKILSLTILAVLLALRSNAAWADGPFPADLTNGTFGGPVGQVTPNSNPSGTPDIYQVINQLLGTSYINNAQVNYLEYTGDASTWEQTSTTGFYADISVSAANTQTFEVYNASTPNSPINPLGTTFTGVPGMFEGNGSKSNPYPGVSSFFPLGTQFGFNLNTVGISLNNTGYIATPAGGNNWYSNPAYNVDGIDHMLVYNLSSLTGTQIYIYDPVTLSEQPVTLQDPYLLSFEDLPENVDGFDNMGYKNLIVLVDGVSPVPEPMTLYLFGVGLLAIAVFSFRRKYNFMKLT